MNYPQDWKSLLIYDVRTASIALGLVLQNMFEALGGARALATADAGLVKTTDGSCADPKWEIPLWA